MKKMLLALLSMFALIFPIIVIGIVYLSIKINIFDNADFWYGYMAYFGTVALAAVALWQNENANLINNRLADMSCKDKIAYIMPLRVQVIHRNILHFRFKKRGNSFGFLVSYVLYIDGKKIDKKTLNEFFEETNTDQIQDKEIDLSNYNLSKNPQITMKILWQNQYGFKYIEKIYFNFVKSKELPQMISHYVSHENTMEIKYIEDKNNG